MNSRSTAVLAALAVGIATMTGCAMVTPAYPPSISNVSKLKENGPTPVAVGAFSVKGDTPGATSVSIRANTMASSVGTNYADYLAQALKAELDLARRLDPKSTVEITGVLKKNMMDASGFVKGEGAIEAQFVVRRNGEIRFDKVKQATAEWSSSFIGNIAIPNAVQNYPMLVQNLLAVLYADPDFLTAIH